MGFKVGLSPVELDEDDISAVVNSLKSGWLAHGPKNKEFEDKFKQLSETEHAIALNSCTSALDLALRAHNFAPGSEVIIPSFTWVSTANAVLLNGLKPVLCDIDEDELVVTRDIIENCITKNTVAVIGVHFAGFMCDVIGIKDLCDKHGLLFVEDSAECLGASRDGNPPGKIGIGCFSFYPTKNITSGEGGMLTTNNNKIAKLVRMLSAHGIDKKPIDIQFEQQPWYREATIAGLNYRMPDPLAALGTSQLNKLKRYNDNRNSIAKVYSDCIRGLDKNYRLQKYKSSSGTSSYQMFTVWGVPNKAEVIQKFNSKGIQASSHFDPPLHLQAFYSSVSNKVGKLENTEKISSSIITLPLSGSMTNDAYNMVCSAIKDIL